MCLGKCGPVLGPFIADVLDGWSTISYYLLASGDSVFMQTAQDFISFLSYHVTLLASEKSVVNPKPLVFFDTYTHNVMPLQPVFMKLGFESSGKV